jgi:U3 small nucleolar RNA-associated protein 5
MSSTKRTRQRPAEAHAASLLPASKRLKSSHVPAPSQSQAQSSASSGLGFLVDEDARAGRKLNAHLTNGVAQSQATRVNDSHAAVLPANADSDDETTDEEESEAEAGATGPDPEVISLSSNSESSDAESEAEPDHVAPARPLTNGHLPASRSQQALVRTEDTEMADAADVTFGDMLRARHPEPIDVQKALQTTDPKGRDLLPTTPNRTTVTPASLGVVLAQALKTKDKDLLEDCFRMNDHSSIRATIQRQQSHQIATLLECIAERIHKRPGRTGKLMTWVQWSLVSHGGYLASQPELMKKLKSLGTVVRERANGLQPLLHLKGKLDLLSAQLELRQGMQEKSRSANANDLDDEENVLYVEGQGQDWSDSDEEEDGGHAAYRRTGNSLQIKEGDDDSSANEDDSAPGHEANGVVNGLDGETTDETTDEEDGAGMLDVEAEERSDEDDDEETTNDEADSDAPSDEDEEDSDAEESEEPEAVRRPKHSTLNRKR